MVGDFNEWHKEQTPLTHETNGYWSVVGQAYKYVLFTEAGELMRNDPYARQLTSSVGNSPIYSHDFDWSKDEQFQLPNWNEMAIYELHIGTFNAHKNGQIRDFYTAIERLDYLKALVINAIELMPIAEFPGGVSWGYNHAPRLLSNQNTVVPQV